MYLLRFSKNHKTFVNEKILIETPSPTLLELQKEFLQQINIHTYDSSIAHTKLLHANSYNEYKFTTWRLFFLFIKKEYKSIENKYVDVKSFKKFVNFISCLDIDDDTYAKINAKLSKPLPKEGSGEDDVNKFRKLLKKTPITNIPKTHLLKKSDLKKHAKIYVVKSPEYNKVALLKDKAEFSSSYKWIHVNEKSLKWLKKSSEKNLCL